MTNECEGAFDTPVTAVAKCDACGELLRNHPWYEELFS